MRPVIDDPVSQIHPDLIAEWRAEMIPRLRRVCSHVGDDDFETLIQRMLRVRAREVVNLGGPRNPG